MHSDSLCSLKLLGSSLYPCLGEACHLLYWELNYLSNIEHYFVPDAVLNPGDSAMSKTDKVFTLMELTFQQG